MLPSTELQRNKAGPHLRGGAICQDFLMEKLECQVMSGMPFGPPSLSLMQNETVKLKGLARTQIPTNKNDDVEFPTFGEIAGVNHS